MKEISQEIINVRGVDYTLFLNRKGLVAWEKFCKEENKKIEELQVKYQGLLGDEDVEVKEDTNPFEGLDNLEEIDKDKELVTKTYKRLYWILLYTNHQMSVSDAEKWYDDATDEYGEPQLYALAQQMIEDANKDMIDETKPVKNLQALRPRN